MKIPKRASLYIFVGVTAAALGVCTFALIRCRGRDIRAEDIWAGYQQGAQYGDLIINYPLDETLFPPEIAPVTFRWQDSNSKSNTWLVHLEFQDDESPLDFLARQPQWTPDSQQWEAIKKRSIEKPAQVIVTGVNRRSPREILSSGRISIKTSGDVVGAAIFYREVNLPFVDAVKDPSNIRWRFGSVSSPEQPPVVLKNLPVCGNCHSFTRDAGILGMDVDYANNKGSYVITEVTEQTVLDKSKIITWSDYKREEQEKTFGLLSQISPDGKFVVGTVKDDSVFVPKPDLEFSQLFFPIKGILCIYDRQKRTFESLPGADDPNYVQSNPTWSPDGGYIVFARSRAYKLEHTGSRDTLLLSAEECAVFLKDGKPFSFDLYRIPFNNGRGGIPQPIEGASNNGMSNYFARYSPNGKWIVFCRAKNYMLLQPDSELYIIPAEGGEARKLRCNTARMNSWHSWSPNSKWLVFSSKVNTAYTQLLLTHIDEQGRSTPPVLLEHFTCSDRAANIPEFVNAEATAIREIREQFVDDVSYLRAAEELIKSGDFDDAEQNCRMALELNPKNKEAHYNLAYVLTQKGMLTESLTHLSEALRLDPNYTDAHYNLSQIMLQRKKMDEAIRHLLAVVRLKPDHAKAHANLGGLLLATGTLEEAAAHLSEAVRLDPNDAESHYNLGHAMLQQGKLTEAVRHYSRTVQIRPDDAEAHFSLGMALAYSGKSDEAARCLSEAVRVRPDFAEAHYNLAVALARQGKHDEAIRHWLEILRIDPNNLDASVGLQMSYSEAGRYREAVLYAEKALRLARAAGNERLAQEIERKLETYKRSLSSGISPEEDNSR